MAQKTPKKTLSPYNMKVIPNHLLVFCLFKVLGLFFCIFIMSIFVLFLFITIVFVFFLFTVTALFLHLFFSLVALHQAPQLSTTVHSRFAI